MSDQKKAPRYSIKTPALSVNTSGGNAYRFSADAPMAASLSVDRQRTNDVPPIGPDIGPDPRNAEATVAMPERPFFTDDDRIFYDFCHGFRILAPKGNYRINAYDTESGMLLESYPYAGEKMLVGERKYYIPWRVDLCDAKSGKVLFTHTFDCRYKEVSIVIPDGGLGDNLAWLPYAEEFRRVRHCKVKCYCGEWLIRIIADRYPEIEFHKLSGRPRLGGYACYFLAIFPKERKSWRPSDHQNFGMQGSVAKLLGLEPKPLKVNLKLDSPRPFPEPFVCISAMATNPAKYWNYPDGWNILIRRLKARGYRVLVIDRDHDLYFNNVKYSVPYEAEDFTGRKPITERIDLLQHADFFIGLPSGLSWLAWNCNVPVVMISGFTLDGSEFPTPYRVTNFHFCHGCWNDSNLFFDMKVPVWCPRHVGTPREIECTKVISPDMVERAIDRIPGVLPKVKE